MPPVALRNSLSENATSLSARGNLPRRATAADAPHTKDTRENSGAHATAPLGLRVALTSYCELASHYSRRGFYNRRYPMNGRAQRISATPAEFDLIGRIV